MAHHKSALKRIRQTKKRRLYNRLNKKMVKQALRSVREAQNYEDALLKLNKAYSVLDKVSSRGVIHKNAASNKKSKMAKLLTKFEKPATN